MAELTSLARPYAKAAFDYAKQNNALLEWEKFLSLTSRIVANDDFAALLKNPNVSSAQKAELLIQLCASQIESPIQQALDSARSAGIDVEELVSQVHKGFTLPQALQNFVLQLAQNDRLALLPAIEQQFAVLKSYALKQVDAYVTSAYPLSDEEKQLLQQSLAMRENAVVILHETVDTSLIGGITIKVGDKFTDGSVRGKLTQLKTQLTA